jgi:hypothetical protein
LQNRHVKSASTGTLYTLWGDLVTTYNFALLLEITTKTLAVLCIDKKRRSMITFNLYNVYGMGKKPILNGFTPILFCCTYLANCKEAALEKGMLDFKTSQPDLVEHELFCSEPLPDELILNGFKYAMYRINQSTYKPADPPESYYPLL